LPSPLIFGGNVQSLTTDATTGPWTVALLTNEEVLAVNQDALGTHAKRIIQQGTTEVWARDLSGGRKAVALFNRGTSDATVSASFAQLGVSGTPAVRDLWNRADVTGMTTGISVSVPYGAAMMYVLSPSSSGTGGAGDGSGGAGGAAGRPGNGGTGAGGTGQAGMGGSGGGGGKAGSGATGTGGGGAQGGGGATGSGGGTGGNVGGLGGAGGSTGSGGASSTGASNGNGGTAQTGGSSGTAGAPNDTSGGGSGCSCELEASAGIPRSSLLLLGLALVGLRKRRRG
jgi:hypothetical protein